MTGEDWVSQLSGGKLRFFLIRYFNNYRYGAPFLRRGMDADGGVAIGTRRMISRTRWRACLR